MEVKSLEAEGKDVSEYLRSLESVIKFQSDILEHMHDDFVVLLKIISENMGLDIMATYTCRENGIVECAVYDSDTDSVRTVEKQLDAGVGELFNTPQSLYNNEDTISDDLRAEFASICDNKTKNAYIVCSGIVDKILYSIVMIQGSKQSKLPLSDCSDMFMNNVHILMENKILNEKMKYESEHDLLTGLYNRRSYFKCCRENYNMLASIGIFFMDVNNLKLTNDKYGHDAGDVLLKRAAESIKAMLSETIHGYRMGGDEFIMVALNCTSADMQNIRQRWQSELDKVNEKYGMEPCVVAVGSAFAKGAFQIEELCKLADDRMYEDKRRKHGGRGSY